MADDSTQEGKIRGYLADRGGSVEDAGGRGLTDDMARELGDKPAALSAVLAKMEGEGVITRDMRGLRTYRISLVSGNSPAETASPAAIPITDNGGESTDSTAVVRASKRLPRGDATSRVTPAAGFAPAGETPPAPTAPIPAAPGTDAGGGTVSLREALARQAGMAPATDATTPPAAGADTPPAAADVSPSSPPAGEETTTATVSLRDALAQRAAAADAPPAGGTPGAAAAPPAPGGPPWRAAASTAESVDVAASLRERLGVTEEPAPTTPTSVFPPRRPGRPQYGTATAVTVPEADTAKATATAPDVATSAFAGVRTAPPVTEPAPFNFAPPTKKEKPPKVPREERPPRRPIRLTPTVKRVPDKTIVAAVSGVMAGLVLIAVVLAVYANNSKGSVATLPQSATDACNVVTSAMASTVFGDDAGRPNFVAGECVYEDASFAHELLVQDFHANERAVYNNTHTPSAQDVPGIGDTAYYVGGSLWVVSGRSIMEITYVLNPNVASAPPANPPQAILSLAQQAVPRLNNP